MFSKSDAVTLGKHVFYSSHLSNKIFYQNLPVLQMFPHHLSLFIRVMEYLSYLIHSAGLSFCPHTSNFKLFFHPCADYEDLYTSFSPKKETKQERIFSLTSSKTNSSFYFPPICFPDKHICIFFVTTHSSIYQSNDDFISTF